MISFSGKQFPKDIILMSVRWYVAYPLSYRNIEEQQLAHGRNVFKNQRARYLDAPAAVRYQDRIRN